MLTPTIPATGTSEYVWLCDQSGRGGRIVFERRRNLLLGLVIASETVDTRLDQNQPEFRVLVLAISLEMLAYRDSLLDQMPKVLRDRRCKT